MTAGPPDARYVFVVRSPLLVLGSLSRRNRTQFYHFWKHNIFLKAWLIYNQACLSFFLQHRARCHFVVLEQILREPEIFIDSLANWLKFNFNTETFQDLYHPKALVHKKNNFLLVSPVLRSRCRSLYNKLKDKA